MTKEPTPKPWEMQAPKGMDEITPTQIIVTGFAIMALAFALHFAFDISVSLAYLAVAIIAIVGWYFFKSDSSEKKDETKKVV